MNSGVDVSELSIRPTAIAGLIVISPRSVTEARGTVRELYRRTAHHTAIPGLEGRWEQINLTATRQGAVRGLHGEAMNKLVTVACGEAFGAYVDTRRGSSTADAVVTVRLEPGVQVFVPEGVCNGFQATAEGVTEYLYFFDREWAPSMAGVAVTPLDPELGIDWPIPIDPSATTQISAKDVGAPTLDEVLT